MELGLGNIALAVGAGLASVLSPCVMPVVPVIVAGSEKNDRLRPLLLVTGLAITFIAMGVISSLFGTLLIGRTRTIEVFGASIIALMGLVVLLDLNLFKRLYRLSNIRVQGEGRWGGLVIGMALGLVWIPCVGPFLSSILMMVGTSGQLGSGVVLLGFYSLGLAIPMLTVAYSSQVIQARLKGIVRHESAFRYISGTILIAFGLYSLLHGNSAF